MKHTIKLLAVLAFVSLTFAAAAQKAPKFGHLDFQKLFSLMPGQDSVAAAYEAYAKGLQNQMATMSAELESKFADYTANKATMSNIILQTKERELQDLQTRIQTFQEQAQQDLADKDKELTAPILDKARKAVDAVAKEDGYTYIFNTSQGMLLLYAEPSDDVTNKVKKKLGIN
jgi:outer membrane protein